MKLSLFVEISIKIVCRCYAIQYIKKHLPNWLTFTFKSNSDVLWVSGEVIAWKIFDCITGSQQKHNHHSDVIIGMMASQITGVSIVYWTVCSGANQRNHQSSASLAFVRGIHQLVVNSPHKGPVTRKMFPFDDIIMYKLCIILVTYCMLQYCH